MKQRKTFQELNLSDNFLFAAVMQDAETCKDVLELLLKIEIEKVTVTTEKMMVYNPEHRGIRMDVFAADENHTVYNVEMQTANEGNLPKRSRFYQSQIDVAQLKPGEDFNKLNKSFVIFICTFDPFGYGRYSYTVEERCLEENFSLGDETKKIFLNTKGHSPKTTGKELIHFLKYIEDSTNQSIKETDSAFLRRIHKRLVEIKHDREMEERYMVLEEMLAKEKAEGEKLGEELVLKLIRAMSMDAKGAEIARLSEDQEFFAAMLEKYQIKNS